MNLDESIKPSDDFYHHVNNKWLNSISIPDSDPSIGIISIAKEKIMDKLVAILDRSDLSEEFNPLKILYKQFKDRADLKEFVLEYVQLINNIKCIKQFRKVILVDLFITHDIFNPINLKSRNEPNNINILEVENNGLGMIDREYYFDDNKKEFKEKYKTFLRQYLEYFGLNNWEKVYEIEESIAKVEYNNINKKIWSLPKYSKLNDMDIYTIELKEDLELFLSKHNIDCSSSNISIYNIKLVKEFYRLLRENFESMKAYFIYLLLLHLGKYINSDTENMLFDFYKKTLSGISTIQDIKSRSFYCLELNLETLLGKLYIDHCFDKKNITHVKQIINFIIEEYKKRLQNSWLQPTTKNKALEKLSKMTFKIGYPDVWPDFKLLHISSTCNLIQNVLACGNFELLLQIKDSCQTTNKQKWSVSPYKINAFYNQILNEVILPAGILQEPFLTSQMDYNFGNIGCIIAHEISHGFDNYGSKFDGNGDRIDWWTSYDFAEFNKRISSMEKLFSELKIENININGKLTSRENISDLCGVSVAFHAMQSYYTQPTIENCKNFFYSNANLYKYKARKEEIIRLLTTDTHPPNKFRVNTILSQLDEFYKTFSISPSDKMYINPDKRVKILF
jgi:putative endopeptidase